MGAYVDCYLVVDALAASLANWHPSADNTDSTEYHTYSSADMYYQTEDVCPAPLVYHSDPNPPQYIPPSPSVYPDTPSNVSDADDFDIPALALSPQGTPFEPAPVRPHSSAAPQGLSSFQFTFECKVDTIATVLATSSSGLWPTELLAKRTLKKKTPSLRLSPKTLSASILARKYRSPSDCDHPSLAQALGRKRTRVVEPVDDCRPQVSKR
ncbi:hypothetical protein H4R34_001188 [Dimargaris verticillata]|uniref:Uncharacterized protein n=1 Tax=Dimargaris verticillata TaxID=2761393 RepID=A0A9W8EAK0_9FUNG|nr:hypothetical protein H4R34_001188 [Dimargaris verticillata]